MTWYLWVWGVATTISVVLWAVCGVAALSAVAEERRKARNAANYKELYHEYLDKNRRLRQQLIEERQVRNEFGRISP